MGSGERVSVAARKNKNPTEILLIDSKENVEMGYVVCGKSVKLQCVPN